MRKIFLTLLALFVAFGAFACSAVVVAGKYTASGRSMMIKVRDSDERDSDYHIFQGPKYRFVGNTAKAKSVRAEIKGSVAGYNTQGLCMASLTPGKGFPYDSLRNKRVSGGKLIYKALGKCKNLSEFEAMCKEIFKERIIIAHIAAIDAEGGAAVYEFGGKSFRKFDANNPEDAPGGWRAMANFSFSGDPTLGSGQERYDWICQIMAAMPRNADDKFEFTPLEFADAICRNCGENKKKGTWVGTEGYITRYRSALTTTFQAAAPGENRAHTIMWAQMGNPFCTPLIPVVLASGSLPDYITRIEDENGNYLAKDPMQTISDRICQSYLYDKPNDEKRNYFNYANALELITLARKVDGVVAELFLPLEKDWRTGKISNEVFFRDYALQLSVYFESYRRIFADYVK